MAGAGYDIGDVPFVVAAGVHDTVCSDDQVTEALHGGQSVVIPARTLLRRNDGVSGVDEERQYGRHRHL
jgi:hypothetical protein